MYGSRERSNERKVQKQKRLHFTVKHAFKRECDMGEQVKEHVRQFRFHVSKSVLEVKRRIEIVEREMKTCEGRGGLRRKTVLDQERVRLSQNLQRLKTEAEKRKVYAKPLMEQFSSEAQLESDVLHLQRISTRALVLPILPEDTTPTGSMLQKNRTQRSKPDSEASAALGSVRQVKADEKFLKRTKSSLMANRCQMREALALNLLKAHQGVQVYVQKDQCPYCCSDLKICLRQALALCPRLGCGYSTAYVRAAEETAQHMAHSYDCVNNNQPSLKSPCVKSEPNATAPVPIPMALPAEVVGQKRTMSAFAPPFTAQSAVTKRRKVGSKVSRAKAARLKGVQPSKVVTKSNDRPQYRNFLWQYCEDVPDPPAEVLDVLAQELQNVHFLSNEKAKTTAVLDILRKKGLSKYSSLDKRIVRLLQGKAVPVLSKRLIDRLTMRFQQLQEALSKTQKRRIKALNYSDTSARLLILEGRPDLARCFEHHRTRDVIATEDRRLEALYHDMGGVSANWPFTPCV